MIQYKTAEEIELMRISAQLVSRTLGMLAKEVQPGVTPLHLDKLAEEFIRDHGAIPGFLGLYDFPNSLCMSLNEQVVHGIPSGKPLAEGDIISIDCGVLKNGYYGDQAYTFMVGEVSDEIKKLLRVTKECLTLGIEQATASNRIGDISFAIQAHAEANGYGVVRELVGHGLGKKMHESPEVPNYGRRGSGPKIKEGLVIAIEPMINMGTRRVKQLRDGWTIITADNRPSAHYEHDVAIVDGKPDVLTTFDFVEEALGVLQSN
ncbi:MULTISPECIES: type I methionyl aminopeptidase [unclassified Imperialibacter]|jgi:methionyl aminopeptidase|uniref:type I methionyl aminopeptidase n=1 Tax=unclassified Imperialibacter TaxID=2629706 RepID=UPI0012519911|nr:MULTISPECIES: type I methionyl aminopeptidase [unclassified Imperialibacter]CAD5270539.1 Methionine aminopeptidase [Imperialibacter sp. 89]CAD5298291.1 Methionine aminopeptidase [Imperialibacter sp. 75]VVT34853.1 Methionine aminopeptidase [Imperialibacter sp. EC-SDR9]